MNAHTRGRLRGYLAVMCAAALWGVSGVVAKALFNRRIEPWTLITIRVTGAFLILFLILALSRAPIQVPRTQIGWMILLGLAMTSAQFTYYVTISLTDVSTALFLQYTAPVFITTYAWLVDKEPLTAVKAGAILLAIAGSYLLVTGGEGIRVSPLGLLTGILSAVAFGFYAILGRGRVRQVRSWTVLLYALGTAAVIWNFVIPPWKTFSRAYAPQEVLLFAFIIVFGTILPFGAFLYGLSKISPSHASLTATLEPVIGSAAALLFLGEALGVSRLTGGVIITAAVALIQVSDILSAKDKSFVPAAPD